MNQQPRVRNTMAAHRRPAGSKGTEDRGGHVGASQRWETHRLPGFVRYKRRILSPHIEPKSLSGRGKLARVQPRGEPASGSLPNRGSGLSRRLLGQPTPTSVAVYLVLRSSGCRRSFSLPRLTLPCPFQMTAEEKMSAAQGTAGEM